MKSQFAKEMEASRERAQALRLYLNELKATGDDKVLETVEQMQTALEELRVADEELRQQNDELIAAREIAEYERQRYADLFEFAPLGYIVTDIEGRIIEANREGTLMLGVPRRFLIGKPLQLFINQDDLGEFRAELNRLRQSRSARSQDCEALITPRHGEPFHAALTVARIKSQADEQDAVRWIIRNITERKKSEKEIRALNASLECRVAERTAELEAANRSKDDLLVREQAARAEAEAANRSKDEFLATISHELRTPLNAMMGWLSILRSRLGDREMTEHALNIVERNAKSQTQIVSDILEVSRIVTGNLRLEPRPVALVSVIEVALDSIQPMAQAKGVRLNSSLDPLAGSILGDPNRLQQVAWNLLSNAVKFTPAGGQVEIKLQASGTNAEIIVSDTGKGISPEFLPFAFDRFRQADSRNTRTQGGLGLGLSIVRLLIEMHGGSVRVESEGEGKGATFIVTLPLGSAPQTSSPDPADMDYLLATRISETGKLLEGVWIVVVDDELDAREMLKVVLEDESARVTLAGSYQEAIEAITGGRDNGGPEEYRYPDVLIADIAMPDMDGFDLIREVRKLTPERGGSIQAIALTAYAGDEDKLRAIAAGFQIHLAKPVSLTELVSAVAKLARRARR